MWRLANELNWTPGVPGRGVLLQDELHTWNGSEGDENAPTHVQYAQQHGIDYAHEPTFTPFYIDPDGGIRSWAADAVRPEEQAAIQAHDPRLNAEVDPQWRFGSRWHSLGWEPGQHGKGLLTPEGDFHSWNVDEWGSPHHTDYAETEMGINPFDEDGNLNEVLWDQFAPFDIDPNGGVQRYNENDPHTNEALRIDPRLHDLGTGWRFGSDERDVLDWDEGNGGKGIVDRDGHVYTWNDDDYEVHVHYLQEHPDIVPMRYFYIEPDGQCRGEALGSELDDRDEEVLREADPRLYVDAEQNNTWSFAA